MSRIISNIKRSERHLALINEVKKETELEQAELAERAGNGTQALVYGIFTDQELEQALDNNEAGDAWLYQKVQRDKFIYDHSASRWYEYQGHYWKEDTKAKATVSFEEITDAYAKRAEYWFSKSRNRNDVEDKRAKQFQKRMKDVQTARRRKNIMVIASAGDEGLGLTGEEWNSHPNLLACPNGVLDINSDPPLFRDGLPSDYKNKAIPTPWLGIDCLSPNFINFLNSVFNNENIIEFLQRLFGYALIDNCREHILPVFWGRGRNGKGTLLEVLKHVLGPLAGPVKAEMFLEQGSYQSSSGHNADIIALRGRLLAWGSETDEGRKLNSGRVKYLVGGDTLVARPPYGRDEISFPPTHTLILLTNHKPRVDANDYALWQRILLVPFEYSFVDNPKEEYERKRDPDLNSKLQNEAPGILAWLIRGVYKYRQDGLAPPKGVLAATEEYRASEDILGSFLEESCFIDLNNESLAVKASDLFEDYKQWAHMQKFTPVGIRKLSNYLISCGFIKIKKSTGAYYCGLGLKEKIHQDQR